MTSRSISFGRLEDELVRRTQTEAEGADCTALNHGRDRFDGPGYPGVPGGTGGLSRHVWTKDSPLLKMMEVVVVVVVVVRRLTRRLCCYPAPHAKPRNADQ